MNDQDLILYLARCSLARKPGKNNWVEEDAVDGLPEYICRIARAIHRDGSHSISQSIAIAVGRVKTWARGGGGVNADTRAKAAKAVAEWERKKKAAKADNTAKMSNSLLNLSYSIDNVRKQYASVARSSKPYRYVREMWSDYLIVTVEDEQGMEVNYVKVPYTVDKKTGVATFGAEVPVKQAFVTMSNTTQLTDAQLEKAGLIPCTAKTNRSLLETVRLSHQLKMEEEQLMKLSSTVRDLL